MRAVRSLGNPYFAFSQARLDGMGIGVLPSLGAIEMLVEARLYATPPAAASANEIHPLLALHDSDMQASPVNYMAIGVTPNRALVAEITNDSLTTTTLTTVDGFIGEETGWLRLYMSYDTGTGDIVFDANGTVLNDTTTGIAAPPSGRVAQVSLFNGAGAYARLSASIRSAYVGWFGSGPENATWAIDSRSSTLAAVKAGLASLVLDLVPTRRDFALQPKPWGAPTGADVSGDWKWDIDLNYTKRVIHKPSYVREER